MFLNFKISLLFFLICISFSPCKAQIKAANGTEINPEKLDYFLKSKMDSLGIPGLSLAVINNSQIVYDNYFGVTNSSTLEKVKKTTLFEAASMSKTVFAYFFLKMIDEGKIDLDTPLYHFMPYTDIEQDERYKLITARMALSHTSGFPNWRFHNEDGKLDIKFTPGTEFGYSGEGYEYLARIIAHLTGNSLSSLDDYFQEEVAQKLVMKNSFFTRNGYVEEHKAYGHLGSKVENNRWYTDLSKFGAAHSLHTTVLDYAQFMLALLKEEGLSKESFSEMFKEQSIIPEGEYLRDDLGFGSLGLGIVRAATPYGFKYAHGGMNPNFQSYFMIIKETGFGFVLFTNTDNGLELLQPLEEYLITGGKS